MKHGSRLRHLEKLMRKRQDLLLERLPTEALEAIVGSGLVADFLKRAPFLGKTDGECPDIPFPVWFPVYFLMDL